MARLHSPGTQSMTVLLIFCILVSLQVESRCIVGEMLANLSSLLEFVPYHLCNYHITTHYFDCIHRIFIAGFDRFPLHFEIS